jgi:cbb3-type cytochrome oxidase subunit 3
VCVCRYIYDPQDQHSQNSEASSILTENMLGIWFWFLPGNREDTLGNVFIKVKREE